MDRSNNLKVINTKNMIKCMNTPSPASKKLLNEKDSKLLGRITSQKRSKIPPAPPKLRFSVKKTDKAAIHNPEAGTSNMPASGATVNRRAIEHIDDKTVETGRRRHADDRRVAGRPTPGADALKLPSVVEMCGEIRL